MRVLLSAYSCEPGRGGEGEIGWRLVLRLAQRHDIWVITRENLRGIHDAAFAKSSRPERLHFIYFDLPKLFRFYKRGNKGFLIYYYLWELGVALLVARLSRRVQFDLAHHLIGGMDWMPAGVAACRAPFLWGPIGSENTHPEMRCHLGLRSRYWDRIRRVARWSMRNLDPFVRWSGARASLVLTHTINTIPHRNLNKARPFVQTGIEDLPALACPKVEFGRVGELRLVYAGELKDWKGALLALQAALSYFAHNPAARLTIVGDGPLRSEMEEIAHRNAEGHRVNFLGAIPMEELVQVLHEGDVFLYPSFHHGLATVVLQAMLTGLPVVCVEGDAIGRAVGQEAGITIPLVRGNDTVADIARAIADLAVNEPRRQMLAMQAQVIARERYSYNALANAISETYADVVALRAQTPGGTERG